MRRPFHPWVLALGMGAAAFVATTDAGAFCRSTTCRSTPNKECPTDDEGCTTAGSKLFWPTSCISYANNRLFSERLDPEQTREIIRKTFQSWSDVPCPGGGTASMTFQEREPIDCKKSEYNREAANVNVVLFQDNDWRYRGIDGTLAKTSVTYDDETGEIYDADIEVNTAFNTVTTTDDANKVEYDLQAILTHEVGHFIGIAHSADPNAVMFASYSPGSTSQRALSPDDVDAVCAVYRPGSGVACNTEPRNGFSPSCKDPEDASVCNVAADLGGKNNGSATSALALALGTGFFATLRRRRSNKSGGGRS